MSKSNVLQYHSKKDTSKFLNTVPQVESIVSNVLVSLPIPSFLGHHEVYFKRNDNFVT